MSRWLLVKDTALTTRISTCVQKDGNRGRRTCGQRRGERWVRGQETEVVTPGPLGKNIHPDAPRVDMAG